MAASASTASQTPGRQISRLEHELAEYVGRRHCIVTGSGTMALTMALEVLGLPPHSEVIIPSICCPAVPFAVAYAGLVPVFCDVAPDDYLADVARVDEVLTEQTSAIVGVHLFGNPAPIDELVAYARARALFVVEDVAQALGGRYRGEMLGRFGEISITSFGYAKILSAGGGGAVFTDDPATARKLRDDQRLLGAGRSTLASLSRRISRFVDPTQSSSTFPSRAARIRLASYLFKSMSFRRLLPREATRILELLPQLDENVAIRNQHAALYRELLTAPGIVHPSPRAGGACFRYTVRVEDDARSHIRRELGRRGVWVSALYPALHSWFGSPQPLPVAERLAPQLVNLPVAPPNDTEQVSRTSKTLVELVRPAA
jgi:dTDP-4-amino-4,6-dideoxygalactose transaminase